MAVKKFENYGEIFMGAVKDYCTKMGIDQPSIEAKREKTLELKNKREEDSPIEASPKESMEERIQNTYSAFLEKIL